jgi:hypothetical protein
LVYFHHGEGQVIQNRIGSVLGPGDHSEKSGPAVKADVQSQLAVPGKNRSRYGRLTEEWGTRKHFSDQVQTGVSFDGNVALQ